MPVTKDPEEFLEHARKQDSRILFDGRTIVAECTFWTPIDPVILSERMRKACAGPKLRLVAGGMTRHRDGVGLVARSFINTDEEIQEISDRLRAIVPTPGRAEVTLCDPREAQELWGELHRALDGGD